jgi:D-serine dehydratase
MTSPGPLNLAAVEASLLDDRIKGIPGGIEALALRDVGRQGWNVLREDLPLPLAVLRTSALEHNIEWMRQFTAMTGTLLCPHGKTTMSPQLFDMQLRHGAWGITAATVAQVQVYRRCGVPRILLANQLLGRRNIDYILGELRRDPGFDFYCLVDSVAGVEILRAAAARAVIGRPLQVLLEVGQAGGRTGVRSFAQAMEVAEAVVRASPHLALRGVEGYEGIVEVTDRSATLLRVQQLMDDMQQVLRALLERNCFGSGPIILSAGGSAYFDFAAGLAALEPGRSVSVILRSGCYITHDSSWLTGYLQAIRQRLPQVDRLGPGLRPALELWAYVQSMPEEGLAIASLGKRDCSFDIHLPKPLAWYRPGSGQGMQSLDEQHAVVKLNDQHAYVRVPSGSPLRVGDLISFGIAHPCTTFDKWQLLMLVNDDYDVVGAVRTFF